MQNVPKIVQQRLRAMTPARNHPDADVLTAFAERSLPEIERTAVLAHMARCGDCRDIVALALPEIDRVEAAVRPSPSVWTWPALRWGFVAAGIVAIATLSVVQYQRHSQPSSVALKQSPNIEVAANEPKKQELARFADAAPVENRDKLESPDTPAFSDSLGKAKAVRDESEKNEKKSEARLEAAPAQVVAPTTRSGSNSFHGAAVAGSLPHGPRLANQWPQQNLANNTSNQASVAPPPSAFAKQQSASRVATQGQTLDIAAAAQPPAPSSAGDAFPSIARAKAASMPSDAGAATIEPSLSQAVAGMKVQGAPGQALWSITAAGGLQRSIDQGKTWQATDVNASPTYFANADSSATNLEVSARAPQAKDSKDKGSGKVREQDAAVLTFRAVAAAGSEVWAGGNAGALYHSVDSGSYWTRVAPTAGGVTLTGDVISVDFPDAQHGRVSTSTSEVWNTSDDGQTWQKQ